MLKLLLVDSDGNVINEWDSVWDNPIFEALLKELHWASPARNHIKKELLADETE